MSNANSQGRENKNGNPTTTTAATTPKPIRRRNELHIEQKKEICEYYRQHPTLKQEYVRKYFSQKFGQELCRSTFSDILRDSNRILSFGALNSTHHVIRMRQPKHPKLEEDLVAWYQKQLDKGAAKVTDEMILEQAKCFGSALNITDFEYSLGWLKRFKIRHSIGANRAHTNNNNKQIQNTAASTNMYEQFEESTDSSSSAAERYQEDTKMSTLGESFQEHDKFTCANLTDIQETLSNGDESELIEQNMDNEDMNDLNDGVMSNSTNRNTSGNINEPQQQQQQQQQFRRRQELLFEQKKEICEYYQQNPTLTQAHLRKYFSEKFGRELSPSTFYDILKDSDRILSFEVANASQVIRMRLPKYPKLEEALYNWYF